MEDARQQTRMLKVLGERNTGTNYLVELCRQNLDCRVLSGITPRGVRFAQNHVPGEELVRDLFFVFSFPWELGWKHQEVDVRRLRRNRRARETHFVATTKNPYAWIVSLARRPHHLPFREEGDVMPLCSTPIPTLRREGGPPRYESAVDMWNRKTASYLRLKSALSATIVRSEDLIAAPEGVLETICREVGLNGTSADFRNVEASTKQQGKSNADYRRYYGEEHWKAELDAREIAAISAQLDVELMDQLDYQLL